MLVFRNHGVYFVNARRAIDQFRCRGQERETMLHTRHIYVPTLWWSEKSQFWKFKDRHGYFDVTYH